MMSGGYLPLPVCGLLNPYSFSLDSEVPPPHLSSYLGLYFRSSAPLSSSTYSYHRRYPQWISDLSVGPILPPPPSDTAPSNTSWFTVTRLHFYSEPFLKSQAICPISWRSADGPQGLEFKSWVSGTVQCATCSHLTTYHTLCLVDFLFFQIHSVLFNFRAFVHGHALPLCFPPPSSFCISRSVSHQHDFSSNINHMQLSFLTLSHTAH